MTTPQKVTNNDGSDYLLLAHQPGLTPSSTLSRFANRLSPPAPSSGLATAPSSQTPVQSESDEYLLALSQEVFSVQKPKASHCYGNQDHAQSKTKNQDQL